MSFWGGFAAGAGLTLYFSILMVGTFSDGKGYLAAAHHSYERCLSDGGTKDHCLEKYLLPTEKLK